jgi:hypothetical protein
MNKLMYSTLTLAAVLTAPCAHAEDQFYVGAALGTQGNLNLATNGGIERNTNHPRAFRLSGGYQFNEHVALEAGYIGFGNFEFASGAKVDLSALHVAAKGSIALGESFSLFGKAGLARHDRDISGPTPGPGSLVRTRAMVGIGVGYRMTDRLSLTAELVDYGTIRSPGTKLTMRQLEVGLNYRF